MKKSLLCILIACFATTAQAIPLSIVNVSAPPINCIFDASCTVVVDDSTTPIVLPGSSGSGALQSRTFRGLPGSPAAGLYAYLYRIDLRQVAGVTNVGCVTSVTLNFGPVVSTLDFNTDGTPGDQVFVVNSGGIGSVGLSSADKVGNNITFNFSSAVCAGNSPGNGQSSFFFGLVSERAPRYIAAAVRQTSGPPIIIQARAPGSLRAIPRGRRRGL